MPAYGISWKMFDYHPKGRSEREFDCLRDGKFNLSNLEIGTGQNAKLNLLAGGDEVKGIF
jgi:hypothetical protein